MTSFSEGLPDTKRGDRILPALFWSPVGEGWGEEATQITLPQEPHKEAG